MDPRAAALQRALAAVTGEGALTRREVAQVVGVHPNTLRNAERRGTIPVALRENGGDDPTYSLADLAEVMKVYRRR